MVLCWSACHLPGCHPWPQMHSFIRSFIHSCMPVCYKVQVPVLGEVRAGGLFMYEEHTFLGRVGGLSGKASHRR